MGSVAFYSTGSFSSNFQRITKFKKLSGDRFVSNSTRPCRQLFENSLPQSNQRLPIKSASNVRVLLTRIRYGFSEENATEPIKFETAYPIPTRCKYTDGPCTPTLVEHHLTPPTSGGPETVGQNKLFSQKTINGEHTRITINGAE